MRRILAGVVMMAAQSLFAGFASNEVYLASVGRGAGSGGAEFYSTVWVTNLSSSATVHFTFFFLKDGQSNLSGAPSFNDTLAPGQTKLYEDVTETKLSVPGQFGAARITADGEIFASERVYNLESATANLGTSEGLFFAAVPKSFAIGLGQTASVQGVNQGAPTENMRSNFDLVETTGNTCKVHVTLLDQNGASQGAADITMQPYGHVKESVAALLPAVNTINGRIVASVTSGSGQVILAGEQLANTSQDSSGFEMSFQDSLISGNTGGACGVCVTSVNGLAGAVTIAHGANTTVNVAGNTITIDSTPGGLTLPFSGSASSLDEAVFAVTNSGSGAAIGGSSGSGGFGVLGTSVSADGVFGSSQSGYGVYGSSGSNYGVYGTSATFDAIHGEVDNGASALAGINHGGGIGTYGESVSGDGLFGTSTSGYGVFGGSSTEDAIVGVSAGRYGVVGESSGKDGVFGSSSFSTGSGVFGTSTTWDGTHGEVSNGHAGASGINNDTTAGYGVYGLGFYAGYFQGDVHVQGALSKSGGSFKIDHPLDPAHKYLYHSFVESPDMKNVYDGIVRLDANGEAIVQLPDWFGALNQDFRYQLTCLGGFTPVWIEDEIAENKFKVKGLKAGQRVSWQVTGIRHDAWANAHRIPVEEIKPEDEQGTFIHPELVGEPMTKSADPIQRDRALKAAAKEADPPER